MKVHELETPALLVDLAVMERNLARMAGYCREHNLRLRPHTKTHKSRLLGGRQLVNGACGLTVAKVGEAEVMVETGTPDLLVAYPVIGERKLERLMEVARRTQVTVALDHPQVAEWLARAAVEAGVEVGVLAEADVGLGRAGVRPGRELVELARAVSRLPRLRFEGLTFYPGHIKAWDAGGEEAFGRLAELVPRMVGDLRAAGLAPRVVSGGSTPTWFASHRIPELNEIRPGTYIFNDRNTLLSGACQREDCAATILCTVVSTAKPGQMLIDGGSKTFSSDRPTAGAEVSFGELLEAPAALFHKMNEEHGYVSLAGVEREFRVGEHVRVLPNHICVAVNLHERVYGVRGEDVVEQWTVDARGKLQ